MWSPQQEQALKKASDWIAARKYSPDTTPQVFKIFGYAGTGKTTLAKELAQSVQRVIYGAYTGKAAYVLQQKGCTGAATIHSLIYHPRDKSKENLKNLQAELQQLAAVVADNDPRLKELRDKIALEEKNLKRPAFTLNPDSPVKFAELIIIDECSMVDQQMGEDLLSFGVSILVLGDPAQLPPVASSGYFTKGEPDVMLTEIHRQAKDNPIIELATRVREGKPLLLGTYGESRVIPRDQMDKSLALGADQILVGRNATRAAYNKRMRELLGRDGYCGVGDKLVCLRNDNDAGLLNGSLWEVEEFTALSDLQCLLTVRDAERRLEVIAHSHYFRGVELDFWEKREAQEFDMGYALTVHKAQGSQWNNVLLVDESGAFRADAAKWLYTGITRAAERVTVIK